MAQTIAAIPTTYNGVRFRSRLEAKWAAFFDHLGWCWYYEPIDLNGWIPDFEIQFAEFESHNFLVEVKPCDAFDEFDEHRKKIELSGTSSSVMLVGTRPLRHCDFPDEIYLGLLGRELEIPNGDKEWFWHPSWPCAITEPYAKNLYDEVWKDACNTVQWKGRE